MKISSVAHSKSKNNSRIKAKLMLEFNVTSRAVEYWFEKFSDKLTTAAAIAIIKEETGLSESEIITDQVTV